MARLVPLKLLVGLLAFVVAAGAGYLLLRSSSVVQVRDVFVVGLRSDEQNAIREALQREARTMTTLQIRQEALEAAVARFPTVASISTEPDFPNRLTIEVNERLPIARVATSPTARDGVPVSAGGVVLTGQKSAGLPIVVSRTIPGGGRVEDDQARGSLAVLARAPESVRARIDVVALTKDGYRVDLRRGPDVLVGSAADLEAKWAAATRVLADRDATGAAYLDVRDPERTVAGGLPSPTSTPTPTPTPASTTTPVP